MKGTDDSIVIRRLTVERWTGMKEAARRLGVSDTQVRRHVSGEAPSRRLSRKMRELRIRVEGGAA